MSSSSSSSCSPELGAAPVLCQVRGRHRITKEGVPGDRHRLASAIQEMARAAGMLAGQSTGQGVKSPGRLCGNSQRDFRRVTSCPWLPLSRRTAPRGRHIFKPSPWHTAASVFGVNRRKPMRGCNRTGWTKPLLGLSLQASRPMSLREGRCSLLPPEPALV